MEQPVESTETLETDMEVENQTKQSPSFILSDDIVKTLKCSLCTNSLSFSPVHIISEDGTKYKCGRCLVKTHINIRAVMYENLAKHMQFPCIYKNCPKILQWKDVKDHEKKCEHRTVTCIAVNCDEVILLKEFAKHFKEKHNKLYYHDNLSMNNMHNSYGLCVLEHNNECYIILYDHDIARFGLTVCAIQKPKKQVDILMNSTGSKYSIALIGQHITTFDERYHCYKCLKGVCKSECHVYSLHSKAIVKSMVTKLERDVIRRTFGSKDVTCTINIMDVRPDKEEENLDDILLGKEMIIDEVNEDDENETVAENEEVDIIKEMIKCPKCKEIMIPPIYECLTGHTLCSQCKAKCEECPACEGIFENTRNYVLEEVATTLKMSPQEEKTLELESLDKEIFCPLAKCSEKVIIKNLSSHFQEAHINNFHFDKFTIKNVYAYYSVDVLMKNDNTYLVFFDFDDMNFGVSICSLENDNYQYEVHLSSANGKYSITAVGQRIIPFNEKEHCFRCSIGTCKNIDHSFRTKRKEVFRRLTTKINRDCVRRMFGSSNMNYKITIVPAKNTAQNDKILRQAFECPICKDYMVPPIYQCVSGHTLCNACKAKLEKCPSCEAKIDETRNLVLEEVAEKVELPCQYETDNCTFRGGVKRVAAHEVDCSLKPKKVCVENNKITAAETAVQQ